MSNQEIICVFSVSASGGGGEAISILSADQVTKEIEISLAA